MKIKILILVSFTAFLFSTCARDAYNPDICFQENILPVFVSKCSMSGCHNSQDHAEGYDFSNYEGIMKGVTPGHPFQSEVYKVIRGNNPSMPLGQKLDQKDISYIKIWIKMGAGNTSNCSGCDTSQYTYSGRIKEIMTTWCVGCHSSANASGGYDLSDYAGVSAAVSAGRLEGSVNHSSGYVAMPQNSGKLNDCDINAISKWIGAGYPNN